MNEFAFAYLVTGIFICWQLVQTPKVITHCRKFPPTTVYLGIAFVLFVWPVFLALVVRAKLKESGE